MPSWQEDLTDEEVAKLGRGSIRVAAALTVLVGVLVIVSLAVGLSAARADGEPGGIDTAIVADKNGHVKEFGYGMVSYGGRGPEAWRWQLVLQKRKTAKLQRRLTVRVLQVRELRREVALLDQLSLDPVLAIRVVFGPYAEQAIRVSSCETGRTFDTGARNGQYRGLFQMGSSERRIYGHGGTALEQARAAYRYFVASGRDWSPWECKP